MNENYEEVRYQQLKRVLPQVFSVNSMLYVGGHFRYGRDLQMVKYFDCAVDVIEIWPENVSQLIKSSRIRDVIQGDIRDYLPNKRYELTMFWHGIEHLNKNEVPALIRLMKTYTTKYIIFAVPNGIYEQNDEYGNPYEYHASYWYVEDFAGLGMQADAIGKPDGRQGNIIAWIKL